MCEALTLPSQGRLVFNEVIKVSTAHAEACDICIYRDSRLSVITFDTFKMFLRVQ